MRRRSLRLAPILLAGALAATAPAGDDPPRDPYDAIVADFRERMKGASVEDGVAAVELLDPNNPRSLPELLGVLARSHWMVRGKAMESLSRVEPGPLRAEMRLHLVTHEDPWVREGMALAMATLPQAGDADALLGAMDDPEWRVRRAAARGLGEIVSRGGAGRLVDCLEQDPDLRVRAWARASLRGIVGRDRGRDPAQWRAWWDLHKDKEEWGKEGEEVRREDFAGVPLETVTVGGPPPGEGSAQRPDKPDLFVLPPFGFGHGWFRPYLDDLSDEVRITYVNLPRVAELTGKSGYGGSVAVYPVKRLSRALEELRESMGRQRIVVLAAGPVGWIAEHYAREYEDSTSALVVVNGWLDTHSYADALLRLAREGDRSEKWAAKVLLGQVESGATEDANNLVGRILLTHLLGDRRDSEAFRIWSGDIRDDGFVRAPSIRFDRHVKVHTPTLFYFPADSPLGGASEEDLRRIRDSYKKPPPVIAVMRDSRGFSHVEDPEEFLRILRGFLKLSGVL